MNAPDILAVLLVLRNFSSNEIIIILFPNMIRTFPISNNEYNYHFVPFSPPKYNTLPPPLREPIAVMYALGHFAETIPHKTHFISVVRIGGVAKRLENVSLALIPQPPYISTTRGTQIQLLLRQPRALLSHVILLQLRHQSIVVTLSCCS